MFPSYANLVKFKGRVLKVPGIQVGHPKNNPKSVPVSLVADGDGNLVLGAAKKGGNGVFVFYEHDEATYGYADAGISWACSGPYTGCRFQIGVNEGRIYVAHIAVESGSGDHSADLKAMLPEAAVKLDHKTSAPPVTKAMKLLEIPFSVKYLFAWWGGNFEAAAVTEVVVVGNSQDGGTITEVTQIAG